MDPLTTTAGTDGPSRPTIAWIALAVLLAHNAEEAFAFRAYLPRMPLLLPAPLATLAAAIDYPDMLAALAIFSALATCLAVAAALRPDSPRALWLLLVLQALMGINAIAHAASALLVFRGYGPGLVTALLLNAPFAIYCFRRARRERWVGHTALAATVPAALLLHGPVLYLGLWLLGAGHVDSN